MAVEDGVNRTNTDRRRQRRRGRSYGRSFANEWLVLASGALRPRGLSHGSGNALRRGVSGHRDAVNERLRSGKGFAARSRVSASGDRRAHGLGQRAVEAKKQGRRVWPLPHETSSF